MVGTNYSTSALCHRIRSSIHPHPPQDWHFAILSCSFFSSFSYSIKSSLGSSLRFGWSLIFHYILASFPFQSSFPPHAANYNGGALALKHLFVVCVRETEDLRLLARRPLLTHFHLSSLKYPRLATKSHDHHLLNIPNKEREIQLSASKSLNWPVQVCQTSWSLVASTLCHKPSSYLIPQKTWVRRSRLPHASFSCKSHPLGNRSTKEKEPIVKRTSGRIC